VRGWDRRNAHYFQMIQSLAKHFRFDIESPWDELPREGAAGAALRQRRGGGRVPLPRSRRKLGKRKHRFEGILPNLERRYRETESATVREELAKYLGHRAPAPTARARASIRTARHVFVGDRALPSLTRLPVARALEFFSGLEVAGWRGEVAARIVKEVADRLRFLVDVGLDYLALDRSADTLSGGEAQRIRLASQIGSGLTGVMYILDEPSIGLHQRDNARLLATLRRLRDLGNTVLVVEHDEDAIRAADHVIDLGPGAGVHGGRLVAQGTPARSRPIPAR
jgi:excinuclease ABC subunit A